MATAKVSLSLDESLLLAARNLVGRGGLSGYINRALRHQLQQDRLKTLLGELEQEAGPIDSRTMDEVRQAWPADASPHQDA